jgi:hypothetical protein
LKKMEWTANEMYPFARSKITPSTASRDCLLGSNQQHNVISYAAEIQSRQSRLVVEDTIKEACAMIATASTLVSNRALATSDAFLRFHLLAAAREIAAMPATLNYMMHDDAEAPCLTRVVEREIGWLKAAYPERIGQINCGFAALQPVPSWSSAYIFGAIARIFLEDAVLQAPSQTQLFVRLAHDKDILRFGVVGAGKCGETEFMQRICAPGRCRSLLASLSGRIETAANGLTVTIPIIAFTSLETVALRPDQ